MNAPTFGVLDLRLVDHFVAVVDDQLQGLQDLGQVVDVGLLDVRRLSLVLALRLQHRLKLVHCLVQDRHEVLDLRLRLDEVLQLLPVPQLLHVQHPYLEPDLVLLLVRLVANLRKLDVQLQKLLLLLRLLLADLSMRLYRYCRYPLVANPAHQQRLSSYLVVLADLQFHIHDRKLKQLRESVQAERVHSILIIFLFDLIGVEVNRDNERQAKVLDLLAQVFNHPRSLSQNGKYRRNNFRSLRNTSRFWFFFLYRNLILSDKSITDHFPSCVFCFFDSSSFFWLKIIRTCSMVFFNDSIFVNRL